MPGAGQPGSGQNRDGSPNADLVPAMVPVVGVLVSGDKSIACVAGWVPKEQLYTDLTGLDPQKAAELAEQSASHPPEVFDEKGVLVGHFLPEKGFVALG